jgi:hypothetical protein
MRLRTVLIAIGLISVALSVEAQILTGNIIGVVRDESNAVLPGVTVTLTSPALPGGPQTTVTNEQGAYRFAGLPPGVYELSVSLTGFSSYKETDLRTSAGGTIERQVSLKVAAVEETVMVSGQSPVVDPRQVGVVKNMSADVVESLPHNRQGGPAAYMATLPGVTASNYNQIGGVTVMGSNNNETSYMTDGILSNNVISGGAYAYLDFDNIEDLAMVTLGASSEYQQAQGGVMNMVTKAGTNKFRADALQYWAPARLTSSPIVLPCTGCPPGTSTGFKLYKYRDFGYHAGGPIWKDHIWYYGGLNNAGPSFRNPGQPDTPEDFRRPQDDYHSNQKFTAKIGDKINLSQVIYYEWWHWTSPQYPTATNPLETIFWYTGDIRGSASEVTSTLTPTTLLTARFTLNSMPYGYIPYGPNLDHSSSALNAAAHTDLLTGVSSVSSAPAYVYQARRDDVSIKLNKFISRTKVTQNVRVGVQIARNKLGYQAVTPGGMVFQDQGGAPFQAQFQAPQTEALKYNASGIWGENEITIGDRLTITPGFRWDYMKAVSPAADVIDPTVSIGDSGLCRCVQSFPFTGATVQGLGDLFAWNKVAPRIGMNYKLTGDGKTILRATAGRYYRPIILSELQGLHPGLGTSTLAAYNAATGQYSTILSITDPKANLAIDSDIEAPHTDQFSVGVDRELARNLGASVTFVHKNGRDQIGWTDIGGQYGTQVVEAPDGQSITVRPRLTPAGSSKFLRTNGIGYYSKYNGIMFGVTKRNANRWLANISYTYSKAEGLQPGGNTGRDPNSLINLAGRIDADRPHTVALSGAYEIPKIEVQVSANYTGTQGRAYGAQFQFRLPQGQQNIYFQSPGEFRRENEHWLHLRFHKVLRKGVHRFELGAELRNALQETSIGSLITSVFTSPNFGKQSQWALPRQLMFRVRAYY